jgi:hypothetical protein
MLIRIKRHDKALSGTQPAKGSGIDSLLPHPSQSVLYGQHHETPHFVRINLNIVRGYTVTNTEACQGGTVFHQLKIDIADCPAPIGFLISIQWANQSVQLQV